ncbi:MAG: hypothetical protein HQK60_01805 [Deltaproteobacteria bacterium]|nr:hypothetical protein [Deltaproteobacteria bacterium]
MREKNKTITASETVKHLLTTEEAVIYLGNLFGPAGLVLRRKMNPDSPRFRRVGRKILYHVADLDQFLSGQPTEQQSRGDHE